MTQPPDKDDLILDMLRDVLKRQERALRAERAQPPAPPTPAPTAEPARAPEPAPAPLLAPEPGAPGDLDEFGEGEPEPLTAAEREELAEYEELAARPLPPSALPGTLRVLLALLVIFLIVINLPLLNGLSLARAMPDHQALIIRDGLLLKGSGPQVYVLENNHKRWISSLEAFQQFGYRWENVHVVDDAFLADFADGRPVYLLLKCAESPHIYRIEDGLKRWIKDIATFEAEGHVWSDVRFTSCAQLRAMPDGVPIPPEAGPAPQP